MWFRLPFLDQINPKYLYVDTHSSVSLLNLISLTKAFPTYSIITFVFSAFTDRSHFSQYSDSLFKQFSSPFLLVNMVTRSPAPDNEYNRTPSKSTGSQVLSNMS